MAKMKKSEVILWTMVLIALAANIWLPRHLRQKYSWDRDLSQRLATDFCKTRDEVKDYIRKYDPYVTDEQIDAWTKSGKLESMVIGKRTMYFRNAAPNLFRLVPEMKAKKELIDGQPSGGHEEIDAVTIPAIKDEVLRRFDASDARMDADRRHRRAGKPVPGHAEEDEGALFFDGAGEYPQARKDPEMLAAIPKGRRSQADRYQIHRGGSGQRGIPYGKDHLLRSFMLPQQPL